MGNQMGNQMAPQRADRVFVTGATSSGKSHLARRLFASFAPPRLVIDPKDDPDATGGVYADRRVPVTFHDARRIPDADVARFVPRDPDDLDAYGALCAAVLDHRRGTYTWLDEAGAIAPAAGAPAGVRRLIGQGRRHGCGLIALHQRPVEVARALIANAEHVVSFALYHPGDRDTLAAYAGLPAAQLEAHMAELRPHGFLWYARRANTLAVAPPLD